VAQVGEESWLLQQSRTDRANSVWNVGLSDMQAATTRRPRLGLRVTKGVTGETGWQHSRIMEGIVRGRQGRQEPTTMTMATVQPFTAQQLLGPTQTPVSLLQSRLDGA